jgi:hypothetical protein
VALPDEVKELARRVNNWGRWGADDEIGTLNLLTDDVVRRAATSVRSGRRLTLAMPLDEQAGFGRVDRGGGQRGVSD